jgi:N-acyl-L-homoserine lactone synthetase
MVPVVVSVSRQSSVTSDQKRTASAFSDSVSRLIERIDYQRADTSLQRAEISRLRYQAYLREGAIGENTTETFSDPYDDTDNAYLFGMYIDGELASSLRLHVACKKYPNFPSLEVFPDYLQPELDAGNVLVDSTRFVANERLSRLHRGLPYATLRLCMLAAEYFHADHLLAAVRSEHQAFYRRAFNHRVVCEARPYPQLIKPICLMTVHFPSAAEGLYRKYPFFRSTAAERRRLFERSSGKVAPLFEGDAPRLAG